MDEQQSDTRVVIAADTIAELHRYLAQPYSMEKLYGILRGYIKNAQLVSPSEIDDETHELLHNVVLRAIEIADRYHGAGMMPWLLSIAQNLVKQKKKSQTVRQQKVILLGDLHKQNYPTLSDEEFFELFTTQIAAANRQENHLQEDLKEAISSLPEEDQVLLGYYIHYGYNHNEIAHHLGIKPGAARTRYSRAVSRLRETLMTHNENGGGEGDA